MAMDRPRGPPLVEKELPSPSLWGQVSIRTARMERRIDRYLLRLGSGWRVTVAFGAGIAFLVLFFNIALLAWAVAQPWDPFTNTRTIGWGNCDQMRNIFTYSHLGINVASSLLLGASNLAMQCLTAPTRESLDRAHAAGKWLDVGISGFRNWPHMNTWRQWCWILLMISTVPLHLLYNSALFSTSAANEYYAFVVPSNFSNSPLPLSNANNPMDQVLRNLTQLAKDDRLVLKDPQDCIAAYNQQMVTAYSNLLIVAKNTSDVVPLWSFDFQPTPRFGDPNPPPTLSAWLCGDQTCNVDWVAAHSQDWNITVALDSSKTSSAGNSSRAVYFVDHCLLQEAESVCTIQFIPGIMIVVIICNVVKMGCFMFAIRKRSFQPLVTIGDAITSYLERPESRTAGLGPLSAGDVRDAERRAHIAKIARANDGLSPNLIESPTEDSHLNAMFPFRYGPWKTHPMRWFSGTSRSRWNLTYGMLLVISAVGWTFVGMSVTAPGADSFQTQWSIGIGSTSLNSLLEVFSNGGIVGIILLANIFQLLLSLIYMSFNNLFTNILLSHEFTNYANKRATLRVSDRRDVNQRSTYWLSLPMRFSLPLLIVAVLLHWALSQALFLAEIRVNNPEGQFDPLYSVSCLGFSTLALLITMLLVTILLLAPLTLGFKRYRPGAPIVESNSFAISAACHPVRWQPGISLMPLKYGTLQDEHGMRVSLSSEAVGPLVSGERYTEHEQISTQMLADGSVAAIQLTRWQVIWSRMLAALMVIKMTIFIIYATMAALTPTSNNTNLFVSGFDAPDTVISVIAIMTFGYMVVRGVGSIARTIKGRKLRHFWWHVAPEVIFFVIWFIIFAWNLHYWSSGPTDPSLHSSLTSGPTNFYIGVATGFMLAFLFASGLEIWLWWQQFRPAVASPLSHAAVQASRWFGVRVKHQSLKGG